MLRDEINSGLKGAMKAGEARRVSTLRLVNSTIKNADIEARGHGKTLSDDDLLGVLQKMIKQRQESIAQFEKASRTDLVDVEKAEVQLLSAYLPAQIGEAEIQKEIDAAISGSGASGAKDMGKVMAALKARLAGKADMGKVSALVRAKLSG